MTAAPAPRRSNRPWLVVVALLGFGAVAWFSGALGSIAPGVAPAHCTVGLNGAAVSVSVDGPGAMSQCQSFLSQTTNGGSWYVYAAGLQPAGAMICQVAYANDTFAVRDQGLLNLYGNSICQNLSNLAGGRPTP